MFESVRDQLEFLASSDDELISVQATLGLQILDEIERLKTIGPEFDEKGRIVFHPEVEITKRYQILAQILSSISNYIVSKKNIEMKEREVEARIRYLNEKIWQMRESVLQRQRALDIQEKLAEKKLEQKMFESMLNYELKRERIDFERERFEVAYEKWQKEYELKKERLEFMKKIKGVVDVDKMIEELIEE